MIEQLSSLNDRTVVISGASRGIGLAIGIAVARQGANVVLLAKTATPHPRLPGTVHTAAAEIDAAGGRAAAVVGDVRNAEDVGRAVGVAVDRFGGVDICVNNASAIATDPTESLTPKKFGLMQDINVRGTFLLTQACVPHLRRSANPHVLTIAPPLNLSPRWLGAHPSYTLSKLGWSAEFADHGIAYRHVGGGAPRRRREPDVGFAQPGDHGRRSGRDSVPPGAGDHRQLLHRRGRAPRGRRLRPVPLRRWVTAHTGPVHRLIEIESDRR